MVPRRTTNPWKRPARIWITKLRAAPSAIVSSGPSVIPAGVAVSRSSLIPRPPALRAQLRGPASQPVGGGGQMRVGLRSTANRSAL
jgi:hypothetical protein